MQMACFKAYHFYVANQELYIKKPNKNKIKSRDKQTKQKHAHR